MTVSDSIWRVFDLVNGWIRHAETKAVATLASAGVAGGFLYTLVQGTRSVNGLLTVLTIMCGILLLLAGAFAGFALRPRLVRPGMSPSLLYFAHIARNYPLDEAGYTDDLHMVCRNPETLSRELASQIWANAHVAASKYSWAGRALFCLLGALVLLFAAAGVSAIG